LRHISRETEENYEITQRGLLVARPGYEPGLSRIVGADETRRCTRLWAARNTVWPEDHIRGTHLENYERTFFHFTRNQERD
jgi:hypothetical protein